MNRLTPPRRKWQRCDGYPPHPGGAPWLTLQRCLMAKKRTVWLRNARLEFGPWWWRWWLLLTTTGAAHHTLFGEPCVLYWSVLDEPITEEPPTPEVPRG